MKIILFLLLLSFPIFARELTEDFKRYYQEDGFSPEEMSLLKSQEIILIPGIMSETFIASDVRSRIDLSFFTKDYFGNHLRFLEKNGITVRRLKASSASVLETRNEIEEVLKTSTKPLIFFTHSLGGMALLDHLLEKSEHWSRISGIIFMQSPFRGAPVASVVRMHPRLERIFPIVHTSPEVVKYLSMEERKDFVTRNQNTIAELTGKIRIITVGGIANGYRSIFAPSVSLIRTGCLETAWGRCLGPRLFGGPYDLSDGMVPFEGSKLPDTDFVRLMGVDHGETVVNAPHKSLNHKRLTSALLKLLL
jgi:predicted alpha/beta hydrolase family esterase